MANENLIIHYDDVILITPEGETPLQFRGNPDVNDGQPKAKTVPYLESGVSGVTTDIDYTEAVSEIKITIPNTSKQKKIINGAMKYQGQNILILHSNTSFETSTFKNVSIEKANPSDGAFEATFRGAPVVES